MLDTACSFHASLAEKIDSGRLDVPVLPRVATQVLTMVDDERADASRLSALVQGDAALATRLLATANTMAHGARSEIVSLQQAVARLGMNGVKEVVVAVCVRGSVYELPGHEDTMQAAWRQSLASGGFAKEIARALRLNVEQAYLCGLLHEVGKPVVLVELSKLEKKSNSRLATAECEQLLAEFAPPFGAVIADKWGLPQVVHSAIEFFHDHGAATEHQSQVAITALADSLARHALAEEAEDEEDLKAHAAVSDLNLYPEDLAEIVAMGPAILDRVEALAS